MRKKCGGRRGQRDGEPVQERVGVGYGVVAGDQGSLHIHDEQRIHTDHGDEYHAVGRSTPSGNTPSTKPTREVTTMTTERHAWASHHPLESARSARSDICACGQELDSCTGRHCPRCGTSITTRAAA